MNYVDACRDKLMKFTEQPQNEEAKLVSVINLKIKELLKSHKRIVLCGFTPLAKHFARKLEDCYDEIVIVDETEFDLKWEGIPVIAYDKVEEYKDALFIICSRTIIDRHIKRIPLGNDCISWYHLLFYSDMYDYNRYDFTHEKLNKQYNDVIQNAKRYLAVLDDLSDEVSKNLLARILLFRVSFDLQLNIGVGSHYNHYFDEDVIKLTDHENFVDVGGYTGDTLSLFLQLTEGKFDHYYLFEPEPELIQQAKGVSSDPRVSFYNGGLYDEDKTVKFKIGSEGSGSISSEGELTVKLSKLDNLIQAPVTYIKMDIEGAELAALHGSAKTIEACKPKLAICVYHKYEDILEIYDFVRKCCGGTYKIYLRAEKDNLDQQIVLYAV